MIKRLKELREKALAGEMLEARESKDGSWLIMLKMPDDPAMTHIPIVVASIPAEIGGYEPERRALAALIVETVNNLDKLIAVVEALEHADDLLNEAAVCLHHRKEVKEKEPHRMAETISALYQHCNPDISIVKQALTAYKEEK